MPIPSGQVGAPRTPRCGHQEVPGSGSMEARAPGDVGDVRDHRDIPREREIQSGGSDAPRRAVGAGQHRGGIRSPQTQRQDALLQHEPVVTAGVGVLLSSGPGSGICQLPSAGERSIGIDWSHAHEAH